MLNDLEKRVKGLELRADLQNDLEKRVKKLELRADLQNEQDKIIMRGCDNLEALVGEIQERTDKIENASSEEENYLDRRITELANSVNWHATKISQLSASIPDTSDIRRRVKELEDANKALINEIGLLKNRDGKLNQMIDEMGARLQEYQVRHWNLLNSADRTRQAFKSLQTDLRCWHGDVGLRGEREITPAREHAEPVEVQGVGDIVCGDITVIFNSMELYNQVLAGELKLAAAVQKMVDKFWLGKTDEGDENCAKKDDAEPFVLDSNSSGPGWELDTGSGDY